MRRIFRVCVVCLAAYQFSENTADSDLWGHVLFGEQFLKSGVLAQSDPYSWTVAGQPWINHEILAEIALGAAHRWLGGAGLLLLKIMLGMLTFGIALAVARKSMPPEWRPVAWAFGALAVVEISFGFAPRPQIFSALAFAAMFWLVREVHRGRRPWLLALPPLFVVWINTHGAVLAGIALLWLMAAAATAQVWLKKSAPDFLRARLDNPLPAKTLAWLWISAVASAAVLLINPYGFELVRWLAQSVMWTQRHIGEWNPVAFGWDHAAFFFCAALAAAAFLWSRRPAALWEFAAIIVLAALAFRSARNTPLFCLATLAFVPPHLADVLQRFRRHFERFEKLGTNPSVQNFLIAVLALVSAGIVAATFTLHKERAWTMEAPCAEYPVSAVQFIREHELRGNLLVFFDWGELCIWELPDSPVSIDGRLDTCYPRAVFDAQWDLYNDRPSEAVAQLIQRADYALLPANMLGALALVQKDRWQPVYVDNLAVVLVKNPAQFPKLAGLPLPLQGGPAATQGRAAFPSKPSARIQF